MALIPEKKEEHIKTILNSIPKEQFHIERVFSNGYFDGVAIVKNNKLAGRIENIKFLESVEPNLRAQFLREGKVLSAMQHKNIPRMYDIIEHDDILLFRSENIDGYSLREVLDYLKKHKEKFPEHTATSIISKLMNALYYAHNEVRYENKKRSIIHCDIKPSNILLCAKNCQRKNKIDKKFIELLKQNKIEPFLIDFGIAKFKGAINADGTPAYMSPAQASQKKIDWRTDVYQLLLVYYELLTKKVPYSNIPRGKILEEKRKHDFKIEKTAEMTSTIKDFIEKGTKKDYVQSFKTERDCIKDLSRIESNQNRFKFVKRYKLPLIVSLTVLILVAFAFLFYHIWDKETQSVDAILRDIEHNPNPTLAELESAAAKIQIRGFEKKYYEPLLNGEFRDIQTGKPSYPSYLDVNGNWVLVGSETESAGMFAGLLFEYSDKYPDLIDYAKEYAEPILDSEFDGSGEKRFMYALIPAYEKTGDERYLKKLVNVSDMLIYYLSVEPGSTQSNVLNQERLFLYVYEKTGDKKYLDFYGSQVKAFVKNNVDNDGYIYLSVSAEELTDGSIYYDKWSKLVVPTGSTPTGNYFELSNISETEFKNITSLFSRDFIGVLIALQDMYAETGDVDYALAFKKTEKYYITNVPMDQVDFLFISQFNKKCDIPKDSLATIKSLYLYKDTDSKLYAQKLKALLSRKYFRTENEKGILSGSVLIENMRYDNSDYGLRNQSIIETDALFLELKIKNKNFKYLTA